MHRRVRPLVHPLYGVTGHSKRFRNGLSTLERDAYTMTENNISVLTKNIQRLGMEKYC